MITTWPLPFVDELIDPEEYEMSDNKSLHCYCCHSAFAFDEPNAWTVGGAICGRCNADGCGPDCFAFAVIAARCIDCGEAVTQVQGGPDVRGVVGTLAAWWFDQTDKEMI